LCPVEPRAVECGLQTRARGQHQRGILVVLYTTHAFPSGVELTNILLAAIFAPLFVRIICCAYE